jgi:hypothetical protein
VHRTASNSKAQKSAEKTASPPLPHRAALKRKELDLLSFISNGSSLDETSILVDAFGQREGEQGDDILEDQAEPVLHAQVSHIAARAPGRGELREEGRDGEGGR